MLLWSLEALILTPHDLATTLASAALEKKASEPSVLFVEPLLAYCSHFVIVNGQNARQVRAIANHVVGKLKSEHAVKALSVEGLQTGRWVLIDFGDVVFHVFDEKLRGFYDLDGLWEDAERIEVPGWEEQRRRAWL